jgi:hypothetical protein
MKGKEPAIELAKMMTLKDELQG